MAPLLLGSAARVASCAPPPPLCASHGVNAAQGYRVNNYSNVTFSMGWDREVLLGEKDASQVNLSVGEHSLTVRDAMCGPLVPGVYYTYDFDGFGGATFNYHATEGRPWVSGAKWVLIGLCVGALATKARAVQRRRRRRRLAEVETGGRETRRLAGTEGGGRGGDRDGGHQVGYDLTCNMAAAQSLAMDRGGGALPPC